MSHAPEAPSEPNADRTQGSTSSVDDPAAESGAEDTGTLVLPEPVEVEESPESEIDPEDIVEAAEQLLREAVPHDYEIVIIGAGPGGCSAALRAAELGARVGLIEAQAVGGSYLHRGCMPAKTLLESAGILHYLRQAEQHGVRTPGPPAADLAVMQAHKERVLAQLQQAMQRKLEAAGVQLIPGRARFVGEHTIEITGTGDTRRVRAVHVIVATGSSPQPHRVPGADLDGVISPAELLQARSVPGALAVAGADADGLELAYLFHTLGAHCTLLETAPTILPQEDAAVGREMARILHRSGIEIVPEAEVLQVARTRERLTLTYRHRGRKKLLVADRVVLSRAVTANTEGLGLERAGIRLQNGLIAVDEECQTSVNGVFAIGDCVHGAGWANLAAAEGVAVVEHALQHPATADLKHVPRCYHTWPEIATVGHTAEAARKAGVTTRVGVARFRDNERAVVAGQLDGFVQVVVDGETEKLLGCQIVGPHAGEIINEAALALTMGSTITDLVAATHARPAYGEALPRAALLARTQPEPDDLPESELNQ